MSFSRPLLVSLALGLAAAIAPDSWAAEAVPETQRRFEALISAQPLSEPASEAKTLREFYRTRGFQPAWTSPDQQRSTQMLADLAGLAPAEGLNPAAYAPPPTTTELERDVAVSATILRFGRDLAIGAVLPDRAYGGFGPDSRGEFDGLRFLKGLAEGRSLSDQVGTIAPRFVGYTRLKDALDRMRTIVRAGGWPTVPEGPKLTPGDADDRIPTLRKRLIASGDLAPTLSEGRDYDAPLAEAVKHFQLRHGLEADGAIGARTLANLNVSAEARERQIAVNMERWRWMTRHPGRNHIAVNIPAASLDLVEDGVVLMTMRVVVGDSRHPTPSMNATMSSVVLNPPWSVPPSIANKEILPKLRRDPNYLTTSNLRIIEYPEASPEAAGDGIDWNAIGKKFPYRLRQPPGPDNALGQLKFNLKDSDDIYLHDTPNRKVFARPYRALSHGCVRLEHPVELGEVLLGLHWRGRLAEDIDRNKSTRTYRLERTMPVYLTYWTAWTDESGNISFRDDIYGHDRRLGPALDRAHAPLSRTAAPQGVGAL